MQHFYVWNFSRKKRMISLLVLALCIALLLSFKPLQVFHIFIKAEETALTKGNKKEDALALTFNISWGDEKVHDILKVLKENKTRATFFISGEWAEKHPQIVDEIIENKHEIGMLGYRYQNYLDQELEQVKKDILYAKEIFSKLGLDDMHYIRPPNGHFDKEIMDLVESLGMEIIYWSINPKDAENPEADYMKDMMLHNTSKGDIILLHASDSAIKTASTLKDVIPKLQKKKWRFATISELKTGVSMDKKLIE